MYFNDDPGIQALIRQIQNSPETLKWRMEVWAREELKEIKRHAY